MENEECNTLTDHQTLDTTGLKDSETCHEMRWGSTSREPLRGVRENESKLGVQTAN